MALMISPGSICYRPTSFLTALAVPSGCSTTIPSSAPVGQGLSSRSRQTSKSSGPSSTPTRTNTTKSTAPNTYHRMSHHHPQQHLPDLECNGSLSWSNIKPGATVHGSFQVMNIGDNDSLLNWTVNNTPTWGTWTFTPSSGESLTPSTGTGDRPGARGRTQGEERGVPRKYHDRQ